jgi:hypothetical protein
MYYQNAKKLSAFQRNLPLPSSGNAYARNRMQMTAVIVTHSEHFSTLSVTVF